MKVSGKRIALCGLLALSCTPPGGKKTPSPPAAPAKEAVVTVAFGEVSQLAAQMRSLIGEAGDSPALRVVNRVIDGFERIQARGPLVAAVLRQPTGGGAAALALSGGDVAGASTLAQRLRELIRDRRLSVTQQQDLVIVASSVFAQRWIVDNRELLLRDVGADPEKARIAMDLGRLVPGDSGDQPLGWSVAEGRFPVELSWRFEAPVAAALQPVWGNSTSGGIVDTSPANAKVVFRSSVEALLAPFRRELKNSSAAGLLQGARGPVLLSRFASSSAKPAVTLSVSYGPGQAAERARQAFDTLRIFTPILSRIGGNVKLLDRGPKGFGLTATIPALIQQQLVTEGLSLPDAFYWRARGDELVCRTTRDELDAKQQPLSPELARSPLWTWNKARKQRSVLRWTPSKVTLQLSLGGTAAGDPFDRLLIGLPGILLANTIRHRVMEAFRIPSGGMAPALHVGDHLFVDKRTAGRQPRRGDIVVFIYPQDQSKDFIKRVIGLPGELVEVRRDGSVLIDGEALPRSPCAKELLLTERDDTGEQQQRSVGCFWERVADGKRYQVVHEPATPSSSPPKRVPAGHVFVMGDNRPDSHDSRYWGTLPVQLIKGRATSIWWSAGTDGAVRWERLFRRL